MPERELPNEPVRDDDDPCPFPQGSPEARTYWLSRIPSGRWAELERLRRLKWGIERTTGRIEKVIEVAKIDW